MRIKMLTQVGDYAKGATVPVEDEVGKRYVAAGFAEEAPAEDPTEKFLATMQKSAAAAAAEAIAQYEQKFVNSDGVHPARLRIDVGEQEADRTKSNADFVKNVARAMCPAMFPGEQKEAHERLTKVYKSMRTDWTKKDLAEGSGTTGGYTVAPTYGQELLKLVAQKAVVRPLANVKALPGRDAYYPMLNQTFVPSSTPDKPQSAYYGGVAMSWGGEAQAIPETDPGFKMVHVSTEYLYGLTKISRTLISDSFLEIEAELRRLLTDALAFGEDYAFLQGNGKDMPLGVLNAPAAISTTRANANKFQLADAAAMMANLMPQSQPTSVWVLTNKLFAQLVQLVDASGRVTYIPNVGTGYNEARLAMGNLLLFGRPVIFTEKLPAVGSTGDALLCDFSKYIVANTGTVEIAASDQYAFNTNQITFRSITRVDGQPQIDAPFTQMDGTSTISPFVYLHS